MKKTTIATVIAAFALHGAAVAAQETYSIDNSHSFANWQVRHVVSKTAGTFHNVTGTVSIDRDDLAKSSVQAKINLFSLNSSHIQRDVHVLSHEFLNASKTNKEMSFVSTSVKPSGPDAGTMTGKLTLNGVTREVSLPFRLLGFGPDPWGGLRVGAEASTRIKASDYGYKWGGPNSPLGDEIEVQLLIEGIRIDAAGNPVRAEPATK